MKKSLRAALKTTLIAGSTAGLMTIGLAAASAHVEATPDTTAAKAYSLVTFSVPHGCNGSPTTSIAITLPPELTDATPTVNPNWTITKSTQKLDTPQKQANGSDVTERTSQITYTAKTPLDPHQRDTFVLSVQLPDAAGKTLYFPTLQSCETGQTNWADIPAAGASEDSVKSPAPSVKITAATDSTATGAAGGTEAVSGTGATGTTAGAHDDGASQVPGWIGLAAGVLGLILGGIALARTRTRVPKN